MLPPGGSSLRLCVGWCKYNKINIFFFFPMIKTCENEICHKEGIYVMPKRQWRKGGVHSTRYDPV